MDKFKQLTIIEKKKKNNKNVDKVISGGGMFANIIIALYLFIFSNGL